MDFHHRGGAKPGSAGLATPSETNADRKERLRKLALQVIDLSSDPYLMKNHLGTFECKLCLTLHQNEGSYLSHTQGRKHQSNLARRAAKDAAEGNSALPSVPMKYSIPKKILMKIGRPGYKVTKIKDEETRNFGLLFQIQYPEISSSIQCPNYRFMSAFEQRIETANRNYQYLLVAAEPYETIAFKVQNKGVDLDSLIEYWDKDAKQYTLQFLFRSFN